MLEHYRRVWMAAKRMVLDKLESSSNVQTSGLDPTGIGERKIEGYVTVHVTNFLRKYSSACILLVVMVGTHRLELWTPACE